MMAQEEEVMIAEMIEKEVTASRDPTQDTIGLGQDPSCMETIGIHSLTLSEHTIVINFR